MASSKNFTEVLIGGKVFNLGGFESEEYLQKVSTYLNHKIDELASNDGYRKQSSETRSVLLALNIADDYFKTEKEKQSLTRENEHKDKIILDMKHEVIDKEKENDDLRQKLEAAEKRITELEAKSRKGKR